MVSQIREIPAPQRQLVVDQFQQLCNCHPDVQGLVLDLEASRAIRLHSVLLAADGQVKQLIDQPGSTSGFQLDGNGKYVKIRRAETLRRRQVLKQARAAVKRLGTPLVYSMTGYSWTHRIVVYPEGYRTLSRSFF